MNRLPGFDVGLDLCLPTLRLGDLANQFVALGLGRRAFTGLHGAPFGDVLEAGLGDRELFPEPGGGLLDPPTLQGGVADAPGGFIDLAAEGRATLLEFVRTPDEVVELALTAQGARCRALAADGDAAGLDPEPVPAQKGDVRVVRRQALRRLEAGDEATGGERGAQVLGQAERRPHVADDLRIVEFHGFREAGKRLPRLGRPKERDLVVEAGESAGDGDRIFVAGGQHGVPQGSKEEVQAVFPARRHVHFVAEEAGLRKPQFKQRVADPGPEFLVSLTEFAEDGRSFLCFDQLLAARFQFDLGRLPPVPARFKGRGGALGGLGFGGQGDVQRLHLGAHALDVDVDGTERIPAAFQHRFGAVAAVDCLLVDDPLGDQAAFQLVDPRVRCRLFLEQIPMPPARVLDRGIGLVDPPAVVMDLRQRVFALREEHLPASGEDGERLLGRRQFTPPRLFASGAPFEPLGDFRPGGAGALDQLLAPLDRRQQGGLTFVRADGLFGACVDGLTALCEFRVAAGDLRQEFGLPVGFLSEGRPEFLKLSLEPGPTQEQHGVEQFAVGVPAFAVASGGVRLSLEGAKTALDLEDDVV